jgi:hypothetical protein
MLTFREWLFTKRNYNSPIGDLARDTWRIQAEWAGHEVDSLRGILLRRCAHRDAFDTLKRAAKNYDKYCAKRALELTPS